MFWLVNMVFLLLYAMLYCRFRDGLYSAYPISRKKKRIGFKNYWWFESHFQNGAIHCAYYVNKIFFLAWCMVGCITLCFGFLSFMQSLIMVLIAILGAFLVPMYLWGMIKYNQKEYGRSIVVYERLKHIKGSKVYSSIPEIIMIWLIPFLVVFTDLAIMK